MNVAPIRSLAVVLFTYNHRVFLRPALDGIFGQSRQPDRVLVCDDASPADTEAELQAEIAAYPQVDLQRNASNLGPVANFRQGVGRVHEDAYMLHAGDDALVDPDFLADAVAVLDANPSVVVVYGLLRRVDTAGHLLAADVRRADHPVTLIPGTAMRERLAFINPVFAPCTVIRTSVHQQLPPFPLPSRLRHDWQQWYLLSYLGDFARIERPVMNSYVHDANLSVGDRQSRALHESLAQDYADLLARPEITPADAARLRSGLAALSIRGAPIRELPMALLRHRGDANVSALLATTLADRVSRNLGRRARSAESRAIADHLSGPLDISGFAGPARLKPPER